jgi:hypothetical protein
MEELMKSPIDLLVALASDIARLQPDVKGLERDVISLKKRFKHEGYGFLTIALPALGDSIFLGLSQGKFRVPLGFKTQRGSALPRLFGGLLSDLFEPSSGLVRDAVSVESVQTLRQLCYLYKKVTLDDADSDKLHTEAVVAFFENDDLIDCSSLSDRDDHYLRSVCAHVLPTLSTREHSAIRCKHGPGSVAESIRPNQKWSGVFQGILDETFDTDLFGYQDYALLDRIDLSSIDSGMIEGLGRYRGSNKIFSSSARLVSVPKNSTSRRLITIEPLLNQFVQQGLRTVLIDAIDECPILHSCLALSDQSLNQKLALEGSKLLNWSTLDLKSASDLMSHKLVKTVFGHRPYFLEAVNKCRTPTVENGNVAKIDLRKFGGMGNALTFPIQSVVFAVIAITAILDTDGVTPSRRRIKAAAKHIRVYGDDIIVKTQYARQVALWLSKAGLKINDRKSFFEGNFKESCGVDAFCGVDVTPVYCRFRPELTSLVPSDLVRAVAFSNNCWMRGYHSAATIVREHVEASLGRELPLVSQDSGALGWYTRQDAMHAHKWDGCLQRLVTRTLALVPLKRKDPLDGWPALLKFFHVPLLGRPLGHLKESTRRFQLKSVWKWVPTRVG